MNLLQRIAELLSTNLNALLDNAEDPEVMVKQIIRDMEEGIIELRRETARAHAAGEQLARHAATVRGQIADYDAKAAARLAADDESAARLLLDRKVTLEARLEELELERVEAERMAGQLKADLGRLEDQVQTARRKKEELVRRKRSAEARLKTEEALRRSRDAFALLTTSVEDVDRKVADIESYKSRIADMEAEAEAWEQMNAEAEAAEAAAQEARKKARREAVEAELARLKARLRKGAGGDSDSDSNPPSGA